MVHSFYGRGYLLKGNENQDFQEFFIGTREEAQEYCDTWNLRWNDTIKITGSSVACYLSESKLKDLEQLVYDDKR